MNFEKEISDLAIVEKALNLRKKILEVVLGSIKLIGDPDKPNEQGLTALSAVRNSNEQNIPTDIRFVNLKNMIDNYLSHKIDSAEILRIVRIEERKIDNYLDGQKIDIRRLITALAKKEDDLGKELEKIQCLKETVKNMLAERSK